MLLAGLAAVTSGTSLAQDLQPSPISLETHADPFDFGSKITEIEHLPLGHARQHWKLCAVFPHIKDEYWLSVAYGMAEESRRLGVALTISETGGYRSLATQVERLKSCAANGADAIILGTVSFEDPVLESVIADISRKTPVIAAVNDINSRHIAVKVAVSWREMGEKIGSYLARRHPKGTPPMKAVLATGPREAGWVSFLSDGIVNALDASSIVLADTGWGDTNAQEQLSATEDLLERNPHIDYFLGSAPAVEAMISMMRARADLSGIRVISTYYTQAVRRGMMRGRIEAAPYDDPALQGRLAIEYSVRAIEGSVDYRQIGPRIEVVTRDNLPPTDALAPADFRPMFEIK